MKKRIRHQADYRDKVSKEKDFTDSISKSKGALDKRFKADEELKLDFDDKGFRTNKKTSFLNEREASFKENSNTTWEHIFSDEKGEHAPKTISRANDNNDDSKNLKYKNNKNNIMKDPSFTNVETRNELKSKHAKARFYNEYQEKYMPKEETLGDSNESSYPNEKVTHPLEDTRKSFESNDVRSHDNKSSEALSEKHKIGKFRTDETRKSLRDQKIGSTDDIVTKNPRDKPLSDTIRLNGESRKDILSDDKNIDELKEKSKTNARRLSHKSLENQGKTKSVANDKNIKDEKNTVIKDKNKVKNFAEDEVFTRNRIDDAKEELLKTKNKKFKGKKSFKSYKLVDKGSSFVSSYMAHGSDENAGAESVEKSSDRLRDANRYVHKFNLKKKNEKLRKKAEDKLEEKSKKIAFKRHYKAEKSALKEELTMKERTSYKHFLNKRRMKKKLKESYGVGFKNKAKKLAINFVKGAKEQVIAKGKMFLVLFAGLLLLIVVLFNMGSIFGGIGNSVTTSVITSTYLSAPVVLEEINSEFTSYETSLQEKIATVRSDRPGYDEYIFNLDDIGHDKNVLLSYVTAKFGEVKDVDKISDDLARLFNTMYKLTYESKTETRYRTVTRYARDSNGKLYSYEALESYEWKKLIVTLKKKDMDEIAKQIFAPYKDNLRHYEILKKSRGNMPGLVGYGEDNSSGNLGNNEILDAKDYQNPGLKFSDAEVKKLFSEADKHIGKRYVFGANGPANFDCSSFVCWTFRNSGVKNMPRTTAYGIYKNYCTPISPTEAKPGDIIFFKGTYDTGSPISHVGIYAGNGMMVHAGDPVQYTSINSNYWKKHFYGFGRPR